MNKKRCLIFGGTSEGRILAGFCAEKGIPAAVSVATDYGEELIASLKGIEVLTGRLFPEEMQELFESGKYDLILDATHPHAEVVSKNIKAAAETAGIGLVRVLRDSAADKKQSLPKNSVFFQTAEEAAAYLKETEGSILLTTGSKELGAFSSVSADRLYVRVLPSEDAIRIAKDHGIASPHILALQGPFSVELNTALLRQYGCSWLVTKESGAAGGFGEKITACEAAGAVPVIIGRPVKETGISLEEAETLLIQKYGADDRTEAVCKTGKDTAAEGEAAELKKAAKDTRTIKITILGIGTGCADEMTAGAVNAVREADLIIGASRMVEVGMKIAGTAKESFISYKSAEIAEAIHFAEREGLKSAAVLMSGDSGFYSGTEKLLKALKENGISEERIKILPGISTISALASRFGLSWGDAGILSLHGLSGNFLPVLRTKGKVFLLFSRAEELSTAAEELCAAGFGSCRIYAGQDLGSVEERCSSCCADEYGKAAEFILDGKLAAAFFCLEKEDRELLSPGIPDSCFERDKVPLTKEEIRAVLMAKLKVPETAVCWDIGAGTGGVTAELSYAAFRGSVHAVEKEAAAYALLLKNKEKLGLLNAVIIKGSAPEALKELPKPDIVFVGGSKGNLKEILSEAWKKNPDAVCAYTAVTLETIAEGTEILKAAEKEGKETECVQISAARMRKVGSFHLAAAENPVYIFVIRPEAAGRSCG